MTIVSTSASHANGIYTARLHDPREYISGYPQLSMLGVGFYPIHQDKSPAVGGKLDRAVTTDPIKICYWAQHSQHRSFAMRILKGSILMVVDTESPFKHPTKLGPDGEMSFCSLLEDHNIELPPCPTVRTASDGFHRYFLVPKWLPIRSSIGLWPGIDILASGSNVILGGSRTAAGVYAVLRSFEECLIPEAPRAFIKLVRKAQRAKLRPDRPNASRFRTLPDSDASVVSRRQWWRLSRNGVFRSFWNRTGKSADTSDSAYEFHIAKACFCCGLSHQQTEYVVLRWRKVHGLERRLEQLRYGIIPAAWRQVSPWVERWRANRDAAEEARKSAKTSNMILSYIRDAGAPQTPSSIAAALPIPRERAKKAMQRLADDGRLLRTKQGYVVPGPVGTFYCITTPNSIPGILERRSDRVGSCSAGHGHRRRM